MFRNLIYSLEYKHQILNNTETELKATDELFNIDLDKTFNRGIYNPEQKHEQTPNENIFSRQFNPNESVNMNNLNQSYIQHDVSLKSTNFSNMNNPKFSMSSWV